MRILTVDDSEPMRRAAREALRADGHGAEDILEATNGTEALRFLLRLDEPVDLVLADWEMPGMGGVTLLKTMRTLPPLQGIAVIMVTRNAQAAQVKEALQAGARDFLVKPFAAETLAAKVRKIAAAVESKKTDETSMILSAISTAARAEVTFLSKLPLAVMGRLYKIAKASEHAAGAILVRPGEIVSALYVLVEGEVEIAELEGERQGDLRSPGDCFGEISFLTGNPSTITARARSPVRLASVQKSAFGDLLLDHPELSYHLTRVLSRYHARRNRRMAEELSGGLSGTLKAMPLFELVQILNHTRKTGLLRLAREAESAVVYFHEGEARDASVGGLRGTPAFYALLAWENGRFAFDSEHRRKEVSIPDPTLPILMEGMRLLDEGRKPAPNGP